MLDIKRIREHEADVRKGLQARGATDPRQSDKACILIFNLGAPSQLDTFDPKPRLKRDHGKPMPVLEALAKEEGFEMRTFAVPPPGVLATLDYWGAATVITIFAAIWACDSAAYFAGRAFGRHKLFERVSPKKTWEGAIAGFVGAILFGQSVVQALAAQGDCKGARPEFDRALGPDRKLDLESEGVSGLLQNLDGHTPNLCGDPAGSVERGDQAIAIPVPASHP